MVIFLKDRNDAIFIAIILLAIQTVSLAFCAYGSFFKRGFSRATHVFVILIFVRAFVGKF